MLNGFDSKECYIRLSRNLIISCTWSCAFHSVCICFCAEFSAEAHELSSLRRRMSMTWCLREALRRCCQTSWKQQSAIVPPCYEDGLMESCTALACTWSHAGACRVTAVSSPARPPARLAFALEHAASDQICTTACNILLFDWLQALPPLRFVADCTGLLQVRLAPIKSA
jgi:hypothetical protein